MASKYKCFTRVSASIETAFAFSLIWGHNACVSNSSLHLLRRLLRFTLYCVTMHAFHTRDCIGLDNYCVFLGMALQCLRFTRVSASGKRALGFSFIWCHMLFTRLSYIYYDDFCVLLGMTLQCMRFKRVSASVQTAFFVFLGMGSQFMRFTRVSASFMTTSTFSLVWLHSTCVSHVSLYRLRRLLRFRWYGVIMNAFHTHVCIG